MSRQLDQKHEVRETARQAEVIKALEFGLAGAIEHQGAKLRGFSIKYADFECKMTLRVEFDSGWKVAFITRDSMSNCVLSAYYGAARNTLTWIVDQYQPSGS